MLLCVAASLNPGQVGEKDLFLKVPSSNFLAAKRTKAASRYFLTENRTLAASRYVGLRTNRVVCVPKNKMCIYKKILFGSEGSSCIQILWFDN